MFPIIRQSLVAAVQLLYPRNCLSCSQSLAIDATIDICITCQYKLAKTNHYRTSSNVFSERFAGRVPIEFAAAFLYFSKESPIQSLLHRLKYERKPEIGVQLGRLFGETLSETPQIKGIQAIIPVPLHPKREFKRGYNQAERIATGLSESLGIAVNRKLLFRKEYTDSQTKKNKLERFDNVEKAFAVEQTNLTGKHYLIVDDVMTTGATLEACALPLLKKGAKVSVATIAMAVL